MTDKKYIVSFDIASIVGTELNPVRGGEIRYLAVTNADYYYLAIQIEDDAVCVFSDTQSAHQAINAFADQNSASKKLLSHYLILALDEGGEVKAIAALDDKPQPSYCFIALMAANSLDGSHHYANGVVMIADGDIDLSAVEAAVIKQYEWFSAASITNYHE